MGSVADLLELYGAGLLSSLRLDHRRFGHHVHFRRDGAQIHGHRQVDGFADVQFDPLHDLGVETRRLDAHSVLARLQGRRMKLPLRIGLHGARDTAIRIRDSHRGFGDGQPRGIQNLAFQIGRGHLSLAEGHAGGEEERDRNIDTFPATSQLEVRTFDYSIIEPEERLDQMRTIASTVTGRWAAPSGGLPRRSGAHQDHSRTSLSGFPATLRVIIRLTAYYTTCGPRRWPSRMARARERSRHH